MSLSHERESTKSSLGGSGTKTGRPFCKPMDLSVGLWNVLVDKQFGRYSSSGPRGRRWVIKKLGGGSRCHSWDISPISQGAPGLLLWSCLVSSQDRACCPVGLQQMRGVHFLKEAWPGASRSRSFDLDSCDIHLSNSCLCLWSLRSQLIVYVGTQRDSYRTQTWSCHAPG